MIIVADFWSRYEIVYRGGNDEEDPTDDNFDEESETVKRKLPTFKLKVAFCCLFFVSNNGRSYWPQRSGQYFTGQQPLP